MWIEVTKKGDVRQLEHEGDYVNGSTLIFIEATEHEPGFDIVVRPTEGDIEEQMVDEEPVRSLSKDRVKEIILKEHKLWEDDESLEGDFATKEPAEIARKMKKTGYNTSHTTVAAALRELFADGKVDRVHGRAAIYKMKDGVSA